MAGPFWIIQLDYPAMASIGAFLLFTFLVVAVWQVYPEIWWVFILKFTVVSTVFFFIVPYLTGWLVTVLGTEITKLLDPAQLGE